MKFVSALLVAAVAFIGANAKCFEQDNEEFFLLPATSKARAEERCIENGGKLAEINDKNQNNAASAVAACTEAENGSVDVWIKSWNFDSYNNVGILMNVNKESKGFTIHQYFESFSRKRDEIFDIVDEPAKEDTPTSVVDEVETPPVEEPQSKEAPAAEEPVKEEPPAVEEPAQEEPPAAEEPAQEPVFADDGVGTKYEVLCQVA